MEASDGVLEAADVAHDITSDAQHNGGDDVKATQVPGSVSKAPIISTDPLCNEEHGGSDNQTSDIRTYCYTTLYEYLYVIANYLCHYSYVIHVGIVVFV